MKIAVVGQGFVGKPYSDWFESKGHKVIRYGLEPQFAGNRPKVADAEMVVIAVSTPTTPKGQPSKNVMQAVKLARDDATVVIKSTVLPGTTEKIAWTRTGPTVFSPEFLRHLSAVDDVARPDRTVIGLTEDCDKEVAREVMAVFPHAPHTFVTSATTAEFIKYASNIMLIAKLSVANALYDLRPHGSDWATIVRALEADQRIGPSHLNAEINGKRGAGGACFIKDMRAFLQSIGSDERTLLHDVEDYNLDLLRRTGKDVDLIADVLGMVEEAKSSAA